MQEQKMRKQEQKPKPVQERNASGRNSWMYDEMEKRKEKDGKISIPDPFV
jgi:hypothetical protein